MHIVALEHGFRGIRGHFFRGSMKWMAYCIDTTKLESGDAISR